MKKSEMKTRRLFCEITGRWVELPEKLTSVASLSPAITETFFYTRIGNIVKGVSGYCVHPPQAKKVPVIGSYNRIRQNVLSEIQPQCLFMVTGYQRETALSLLDRYPVWVIPLPATVSQLISTLVEVVKVAGYYRVATDLENDLLSRMGKLLSLSLPPLRIYYEIDLGGPVTFGAFSYITDAFRLLGLKTPYEDLPHEWITPSLQDLVEFDPHILIYEPKMFSRKNRTKKEVWNFFLKRGKESGVSLEKITAFRERKIFITPGLYDFFAHHGPSFITRTLPWLVQTVLSTNR